MNAQSDSTFLRKPPINKVTEFPKNIFFTNGGIRTGFLRNVRDDRETPGALRLNDSSWRTVNLVKRVFEPQSPVGTQVAVEQVPEHIHADSILYGYEGQVPSL